MAPRKRKKRDIFSSLLTGLLIVSLTFGPCLVCDQHSQALAVGNGVASPSDSHALRLSQEEAKPRAYDQHSREPAVGNGVAPSSDNHALRTESPEESGSYRELAERIQQWGARALLPASPTSQEPPVPAPIPAGTLAAAGLPADVSMAGLEENELPKAEALVALREAFDDDTKQSIQTALLWKETDHGTATLERILFAHGDFKWEIVGTRDEVSIEELPTLASTDHEGNPVIDEMGEGLKMFYSLISVKNIYAAAWRAEKIYREQFGDEIIFIGSLPAEGPKVDFLEQRELGLLAYRTQREDAQSGTAQKGEWRKVGNKQFRIDPAHGGNSGTVRVTEDTIGRKQVLVNWMWNLAGSALGGALMYGLVGSIDEDPNFLNLTVPRAIGSAVGALIGLGITGLATVDGRDPEPAPDASSKRRAKPPDPASRTDEPIDPTAGLEEVPDVVTWINSLAFLLRERVQDGGEAFETALKQIFREDELGAFPEVGSDSSNEMLDGLFYILFEERNISLDEELTRRYAPSDVPENLRVLPFVTQGVLNRLRDGKLVSAPVGLVFDLEMEARGSGDTSKLEALIRRVYEVFEISPAGLEQQPQLGPEGNVMELGEFAQLPSAEIGQGVFARRIPTDRWIRVHSAMIPKVLSGKGRTVLLGGAQPVRFRWNAEGFLELVQVATLSELGGDQVHRLSIGTIVVAGRKPRLEGYAQPREGFSLRGRGVLMSLVSRTHLASVQNEQGLFFQDAGSTEGSFMLDEDLDALMGFPKQYFEVGRKFFEEIPLEEIEPEGGGVAIRFGTLPQLERWFVWRDPAWQIVDSQGNILYASNPDGSGRVHVGRTTVEEPFIRIDHAEVSGQQAIISVVERGIKNLGKALIIEDGYGDYRKRGSRNGNYFRLLSASQMPSAAGLEEGEVLFREVPGALESVLTLEELNALGGRLWETAPKIQQNTVVFLEKGFFDAATLAELDELRLIGMAIDLRDRLPWPKERGVDLQIVVVLEDSVSKERFRADYAGWRIVEVVRIGSDAGFLPIGAVPVIVSKALAQAALLFEVAVTDYLGLWELTFEEVMDALEYIFAA